MKTNFFLLLCTILTGQVLFTSILLCIGCYIIEIIDYYFIEQKMMNPDDDTREDTDYLD